MHCAAMAAFNAAESDRGDGEGLHALHAEGRSQWSCRRDRRARPIQSAEVTERFLNPEQEKSQVSALASEVYNAGLLTGDAIAATIAHEVKQPLSGMITNADAGLRWLDHSTPNLDKAKAAFEQIVADGHRAAAVIESIRATFRNDARNRTSLDVNEMIGGTLALLRADLQKHRILVQAAQTAEVPQVRGDRIQLQQVLLNLITNAIDAMATKDGARILRFRSEANDAGGVIVSVADNGPGISPQKLKQIFNPLFTTKSGGMGMGLSICRSIVEAHGGRLWVESNKPEGAVFQFMLLTHTAMSARASRREQPADFSL